MKFLSIKNVTRAGRYATEVYVTEDDYQTIITQIGEPFYHRIELTPQELKAVIESLDDVYKYLEGEGIV